ncbi:MAG: hypothetical protein Kow0077_00540 [Anaerolineae bacterium]
MESQSLILGVVIVALTLLVVAWPFITSGREKARENGQLSSELEQLLFEREAILDAIRNLDFDYETGKLTEEDYQLERESWVQRGVEVLKAIDVLQQESAENGAGTSTGTAGAVVPDEDLDAQIEAAVAARRRMA